MAKKKRGHVVLAVMRPDDMFCVHPRTDFSHVCAQCGHFVGVYPSGQKVLRSYEQVTLICNRCLPPGFAAPPAPGAIKERAEAVRRS